MGQPLSAVPRAAPQRRTTRRTRTHIILNGLAVCAALPYAGAVIMLARWTHSGRPGDMMYGDLLILVLALPLSLIGKAIGIPAAELLAAQESSMADLRRSPPGLRNNAARGSCRPPVHRPPRTIEALRRTASPPGSAPRLQAAAATATAKPPVTGQPDRYTAAVAVQRQGSRTLITGETTVLPSWP